MDQIITYIFTLVLGKKKLYHFFTSCNDMVFKFDTVKNSPTPNLKSICQQLYKSEIFVKNILFQHPISLLVLTNINLQNINIYILNILAYITNKSV